MSDVTGCIYDLREENPRYIKSESLSADEIGAPSELNSDKYNCNYLSFQTVVHTVGSSLNLRESNSDVCSGSGRPYMPATTRQAYNNPDLALICHTYVANRFS